MEWLVITKGLDMLGFCESKEEAINLAYDYYVRNGIPTEVLLVKTIATFGDMYKL